MLVWIIGVSQERRAQDTQREEEAECETEEDGGEDGVCDDHGVNIKAATFLPELSVRRKVLEDRGLDCCWDSQYEGEDHDGDRNSDVNLSLPLHLSRDSCQQRTVG